MTNAYFPAVILVIGILAVLNTCLGILTILLIWWLRLPQNAYRTIMIAMTLFEIGYDCSLVLYFCNESDTVCEKIRGVGCVLCGLSAAFWSNVMVFMVLHVVVKKKIFPLEKYYFFISCFVILIASVNGYCFMFVPDAQSVSFQVYYFLSMASILFNVTSFIVVQYQLSRMKIVVTGPDRVNGPISVLANRLALYPIVQAASRFGSIWYNLQTGNTLQDFKHVNSPSTIHIISVFCSAITSPCVGLGYFVVFLYIQKGSCAMLWSCVMDFLAWAYCQKGRNRKETTTATSLTTPLSLAKSDDEEDGQSDIRVSELSESLHSSLDYYRLCEDMDEDALEREITRYGDNISSYMDNWDITKSGKDILDGTL